MQYIDNAKMQRVNDKPFALFGAINPPYTPFDQVPGKYPKRYNGMGFRTGLNCSNVE